MLVVQLYTLVQQLDKRQLYIFRLDQKIGLKDLHRLLGLLEFWLIWLHFIPSVEIMQILALYWS